MALEQRILHSADPLQTKIAEALCGHESGSFATDDGCHSQLAKTDSEGHQGP
ncbi:LEPR-XLL domain-containing protein [Halogeometricum luteum]|uniref:LEPR-XLL domain-containing protein n=1 Tax=Halogeometricum luteum TaxID=2950537 RepID=UPI003CCCA348